VPWVHPQAASAPAPDLTQPPPPRFHLTCAQTLTVACRPCLTFTPGALALLGRGGLRSLTLSCNRLGTDTLQHLGCLTGLTRLEVTADYVCHPGDPESPDADVGAALRHLTALSGLTQLAHLHVELGGGGVLHKGLPPAAELLAVLPRAPLKRVGGPSPWPLPWPLP
jgi:hypothetical protein